MKKIKRIWSLLLKNIRKITFFTSLILIGLSTHIIIKNAQYQKQRTVNIWQESFDLTRIPNGLVIWKHGVPGTEASFIHADTTTRYYFFDVGILTDDKIVHKIRIPFYIMGTIRIGYPTQFRKKPKINPNLRNPKSNSYVYPFEKESFLEKNKNS